MKCTLEIKSIVSYNISLPQFHFASWSRLLGMIWAIPKYNCTPLLMTNIKVFPQDIKPLHHTPPGHYFGPPLDTLPCTLPLNPLWTQPDVGYLLRTLPLNPLWTHLDVGHPLRTLPLNPLWTHLDVGHPPRTLPLNPLWTHPDVGYHHLWNPFGHISLCDTPRTLPSLPLDPPLDTSHCNRTSP